MSDSLQSKGDWLSRYGQLTILELKNLNFKGQGQIQTDSLLWQPHLQERGVSLVDELINHPHSQSKCPEIMISKQKYNILKRYHERGKNDNCKRIKEQNKAQSWP